jgi:hypothetical protein
MLAPLTAPAPWLNGCLWGSLGQGAECGEQRAAILHLRQQLRQRMCTCSRVCGAVLGLSHTREGGLQPASHGCVTAGRGHPGTFGHGDEAQWKHGVGGGHQQCSSAAVCFCMARMHAAVKYRAALPWCAPCSLAPWVCMGRLVLQHAAAAGSREPELPLTAEGPLPCSCLQRHQAAWRPAGDLWQGADQWQPLCCLDLHLSLHGVLSLALCVQCWRPQPQLVHLFGSGFPWLCIFSGGVV